MFFAWFCRLWDLVYNKMLVLAGCFLICHEAFNLSKQLDLLKWSVKCGTLIKIGLQDFIDQIHWQRCSCMYGLICGAYCALVTCMGVERMASPSMAAIEPNIFMLICSVMIFYSKLANNIDTTFNCSRNEIPAPSPLEIYLVAKTKWQQL